MGFAVVGVVVLVSLGFLLAGSRRRLGRAWFGRRVPSRPVRERLTARTEAGGERRAGSGRRVHADVPVARSRAIELANRRAIRWKDQT